MPESESGASGAFGLARRRCGGLRAHGAGLARAATVTTCLAPARPIALQIGIFQIRKFDGVGHHLPPIVASMPAIHGTRRAEELDAHATSTGLNHGLAKLSVIVPRRGSRRGTGPVGGGTTRSFVHVWSFAYPASVWARPRGCIDGWPDTRPVVRWSYSTTSRSGASSLGSASLRHSSRPLRSNQWQASAGDGDRRLPVAAGRRKPGRLSLECMFLENMSLENTALRCPGAVRHG